MVHSSVNNFTKGNFKQSLKEQLALKPTFVLSDWENNSLISEKQEKHKELIFHIQRIFKMKVKIFAAPFMYVQIFCIKESITC